MPETVTVTVKLPQFFQELLDGLDADVRLRVQAEIQRRIDVIAKHMASNRTQLMSNLCLKTKTVQRTGSHFNCTRSFQHKGGCNFKLAKVVNNAR